MEYEMSCLIISSLILIVLGMLVVPCAKRPVLYPNTRYYGVREVTEGQGL